MDLDTVGRLDPYVNGSQLTVSVLLDENALFMHADLYSAVPMVAHHQFFSSKVAFIWFDRRENLSNVTTIGMASLCMVYISSKMKGIKESFQLIQLDHKWLMQLH